MFAGVLVNDLSADRHFLIGSNLEGLQGFIREAWDEVAPQLTLWPETAGTPPPPLEVLQSLARRFRLTWTTRSSTRPLAGDARRPAQGPARG